MNRDFKGVWIPKELWLDNTLKPTEKFFLLEIDSLDGEAGCYAANQHFAELFNLSKGRCSQIISTLEKNGLIKVELIYKGKEVEKRTIKVVNKLKTPLKKTNRPPLRKHTDPPLINAQENNTKSNNTKSNRDNQEKKSAINPDEIVNLFNSILYELPKVITLNNQRKTKIANLSKKDLPTLQAWEQFFEIIKSSDFLMGRAKDFKSNFDWIIKPANAIKIAEGNYTTSTGNNNGKQDYDHRAHLQELADGIK